MRIERWQNSETGEIYELEWPDLPAAPEDRVEASQLPPPTDEAADASGAVLDGLEARPGPPAQPTALSPRRMRLLARLIRTALEGSDA